MTFRDKRKSNTVKKKHLRQLDDAKNNQSFHKHINILVMTIIIVIHSTTSTRSKSQFSVSDFAHSLNYLTK